MAHGTYSGMDSKSSFSSVVRANLPAALLLDEWTRTHSWRASSAALYARGFIGWEAARVTERNDDRHTAFKSTSQLLPPATCSLWSASLSIRGLIGLFRLLRPELSTLLKHEPERGSSAAQSAILIWHEGKKTWRGALSAVPSVSGAGFRLNFQEFWLINRTT